MKTEAENRIDARKSAVLKLVVNEYVRTSQPVASSRISDVMGLSPASVRNEMSTLSRLGLLLQPHVSAGRIPTDAGYRFFVDNIMEELIENETLGRLTQKFLRTLHLKLELLLRQVVMSLSELTDCICFVSIPQVEMSEISNIGMQVVSPRIVLLVLVLSNGMVENKLIETPNNAGDLPIDRIGRVLNERLRGKPLSAITPEALNEVFDEIRLRETAICDAVMTFFQEAAASADMAFFVDGLSRILKAPEFRDETRLEPIINLLEQRDGVLRGLNNPPAEDGIGISIGGESGIGALAGCSVIRGSFNFGDNTKGTLGLIGPTRLNYQRASGLVRALSTIMSRSLSGFSLT